MPVDIPTNSAWTNQRLVLSALLHREAVTRFGKYKLGVLWLLVEPLTSVIVLGLVLGPIVGRTAPRGDPVLELRFGGAGVRALSSDQFWHEGG